MKQTDILKESALFYRSLYENKDDTLENIASGSIVNRIELIIDKLIDKDQTGFVKGRYIGESIRLIYDLLNFTEQNNIPRLILLIDFEKTFDSLSWQFIQKALKFLKFGNSLVRHNFCSLSRWLFLFIFRSWPRLPSRRPTVTLLVYHMCRVSINIDKK